MFRWHVVSAVFWRNVKQYFSGPLGYMFIVVFVSVCAIMAFSPQFFADNQATLDQLSRWFPVLLLFFVPAITMTVWAEEKKSGTDSILFTLPASDFDILLGKYLAVAAVYTIALLFSLTQVLVLNVLGNPDWGVLTTTYIGYWLAGLALLSVGMFASSLSSNSTVAFVLGAIFCAIPVLIGYYFRGFVGLERFGFEWNLRDFTLGLVPLGNIAYFLGLTIFMLYLNMVVISRRHWYQGEKFSIGGQYFIRSISLAVILGSLWFLCNTAVSSLWSRADLTHEKLYTLDKVTVDTLKKVKDAEREVTVQAFVSKDVPRKFVNTKKQFVGLLRQFSEYGGKNVSVRFVEVEPNSPKAIEAEQAGVEGQADRSEIGGRMVEQKVFLGATVSSSLDDVALPFVGDDSSIEYELTRSIAKTIDKKNQITIGIVDTDAHFGGPEMEGRRLEWAYNTTLNELKKQFDIKHIAANDLINYVEEEKVAPVGDDDVEIKDSKKLDPPDVLLVPDPSSLDELGMGHLIKYVESGYPTILLTDPIPFFWTYQNPINIGILNAPKQVRVSQRSPYAQILSSSALPKSDAGSASKILKTIGVDWNNGAAAWSDQPSHPNFDGTWPDFLGNSWPEYYGRYDNAFVFVSNHGGHVAFNQESMISKGLKEVLMFYPGSLKKSADSTLDFQPLISLGTQSGITPWERLTMTPTQQIRTFDPRTGAVETTSEPATSQITQENLKVLDPASPRSLDDDDHVIAARVSGGPKGIDVVVIADMDFVSDIYYTQQEELGEKLDNLALLQNSIEILAGNEGFVALRNRRATPRTLERLEAVIGQYRTATTKEQAALEKRTEDELEKENEKLKEANKAIQENESMGFFEKIQRSSQEGMEAQRRFDLKKKKMDRELKKTVAELESKQQQQISGLESRTRYLAILAAPLPALLLGLMVFFYRKVNEDRNITADRRVAK